MLRSVIFIKLSVVICRCAVLCLGAGSELTWLWCLVLLVQIQCSRAAFWGESKSVMQGAVVSTSSQVSHSASLKLLSWVIRVFYSMLLLSFSYYLFCFPYLLYFIMMQQGVLNNWSLEACLVTFSYISWCHLKKTLTLHSLISLEHHRYSVITAWDLWETEYKLVFLLCFDLLVW